MMGIFLDTGFFLALVDSKDSHHNRATEFLDILATGKYGQIHTSNFVMSETMTIVSARTDNNPIALEEIKDIFIGETNFFLIMQSTKELEKKTIELFLKINKDNRKERVSFVDCSNIEFCERFAIENILSFDKHFDGWVNRIY